MYISEGYVILSLTKLIISLLLTLADRQHVSALFNSQIIRPSRRKLSTRRLDDRDLHSAEK
jgi:hypothetical protein